MQSGFGAQAHDLGAVPLLVVLCFEYDRAEDVAAAQASVLVKELLKQMPLVPRSVGIWPQWVKDRMACGANAAKGACSPTKRG
jgi:hypothetical protein